MITRTYSLRRRALTQLASLAILIPLSLWIARPLLDTLDWGSVGDAFGQISTLSWTLAALATCASFAALGCYDVVVHRHLQTGVPDRDAQRSGICAVALSQFLGLAVVTGTVARWQSSDRITAAQAATVTGLVSVSFMGAWLGLFGTVGLLTPGALPLPPYVFVACLISAVCFALFTVLHRHVTLRGRRFRMPSLRALRSMGVLTALDTGFAALALWLLLPDAAQFSYAALLPIYLAGLGLALVSNTPGGVGPFEVTILWALHTQDVNAVLAAVLAFRTLYYALPAVLAAAYLLLRRRNSPAESAHYSPTPYPPADPRPKDMDELHPEAGIARQGSGLLRTINGAPLAALQVTTQTTAALYPSEHAQASLFTRLAKTARANATDPIAYKIPAELAVHARRKGWTITRIAEDAVLDPSTAKLDRPNRSGLRRKLRKAAKAGVSVMEVSPARANWDALRAVDIDWTGSQGGARGFSMGRFCAEYMSEQRLFVAKCNGHIIGFATFHDAEQGWALDLIRHVKNAPDGLMHALIWAAVGVAESEDVKWFSLASAPCKTAPFYRALMALRLMPRDEGNGLIQFKRSFGPRWVPLYAAAPRMDQLLLGLWDIWQEVKDPPPLTGAPEPLGPQGSHSLV